jgi:HhH-GPD superfamily base excision DNA repair protein
MPASSARSARPSAFPRPGSHNPEGRGGARTEGSGRALSALADPAHHRDPYTLLIAVLLPAQCADVRVNQVAPQLFTRADTPEAMAPLGVRRIEAIIRPCELAPANARHIRGLSRMVLPPAVDDDGVRDRPAPGREVPDRDAWARRHDHGQHRVLSRGLKNEKLVWTSALAPGYRPQDHPVHGGDHAGTEGNGDPLPRPGNAQGRGHCEEARRHGFP